MSQHDEIEEVRELYNRFATSWDENRPEDLAACFTADGVFESGHGHFAGSDAIVENMAYLNGAMGRRKQRHVITNLSIHLEGDRGTGTAYFIDCVALDGKILVIAFGTGRIAQGGRTVVFLLSKGQRRRRAGGGMSGEPEPRLGVAQGHFLTPSRFEGMP